MTPSQVTETHGHTTPTVPLAAALATGRRPRPGDGRRAALRPGIAPFLVALALAGAVSWLLHTQRSGPPGLLAWATTILWTLPITGAVLGGLGALRAARTLRRTPGGPVTPVHEPLLVVLPTVGRFSTLPALERVVRSYCRHLPRLFSAVRVDVVVEERCEALGPISALVDAFPMVRLVVVPHDYATANGTRFKARANHYAHELRIREGEARPDVWVLHMDDDTAVEPGTVTELARFVQTQGAAGAHLAQGVLTFPRELAATRLLWLADAIRPACDLSLFSLTTGGGRPLAGLHGELLLVRASVEAEIGWDFGPRAVVEDAQFALHFCRRHPGRSAWVPARSLGATPVTPADFLRQRERWAWGLFELSVNRAVPLRHRLLLLHNMAVWALGPVQHFAVLLAVGYLLADTDTAPVVSALLPVWAVTVGYAVWQYWTGLRINARASAAVRRRWWEPIVLLVLIPVFSLGEAAGVLRGLVRFLRHGETSFTVIAKPR